MKKIILVTALAVGFLGLNQADASSPSFANPPSFTNPKIITKTILPLPSTTTVNATIYNKTGNSIQMASSNSPYRTTTVANEGSYAYSNTAVRTGSQAGLRLYNAAGTALNQTYFPSGSGNGATLYLKLSNGVYSLSTTSN